MRCIEELHVFYETSTRGRSTAIDIGMLIRSVWPVRMMHFNSCKRYAMCNAFVSSRYAFASSLHFLVPRQLLGSVVLLVPLDHRLAQGHALQPKAHHPAVLWVVHLQLHCPQAK